MKSLLILPLLLLTGCAAATPTSSPTPTDEPMPTNPPRIISTMAPSSTPPPTATPAPTATATRTPTATPSPEPLRFAGQGDQVLDVEKWPGLALVYVEHAGESNFMLRNFDSSGERIDLLVNTIGDYRGLLLIDYDRRDRATARLQIQADGEWQILIEPVGGSLTTTLILPADHEGTGDSVLFFDGSPDLFTIDGRGDNNLILRAIDRAGDVDLILNEIGPYNGQGILPVKSIAVIVRATGAWSIAVTRR